MQRWTRPSGAVACVTPVRCGRDQEGPIGLCHSYFRSRKERDHLRQTAMTISPITMMTTRQRTSRDTTSVDVFHPTASCSPEFRYISHDLNPRHRPIEVGTVHLWKTISDGTQTLHIRHDIQDSPCPHTWESAQLSSHQSTTRALRSKGITGTTIVRTRLTILDLQAVNLRHTGVVSLLPTCHTRLTKLGIPHWHSPVTSNIPLAYFTIIPAASVIHVPWRAFLNYNMIPRGKCRMISVVTLDRGLPPWTRVESQWRDSIIQVRYGSLHPVP